MLEKGEGQNKCHCRAADPCLSFITTARSITCPIKTIWPQLNYIVPAVSSDISTTVRKILINNNSDS